MAIVQVGRATQLAYNDGTSKTIDQIQSYSFSQSQEMAQFTKGTARVATHFAGMKTGSITIETADIAKWSGFTVGQKLTSVVLTIESATDAGGTATGGAIEITFPNAVVSEIGDLSASNENSAPAVASVTFTLDRLASASSDPAITIAEDT